MTFEKWFTDNKGIAGPKWRAKATWEAATLAERERCERTAIYSQRSVSTMPTVDDCVTYNEACRDVAAAIRKGEGV